MHNNRFHPARSITICVVMLLPFLLVVGCGDKPIADPDPEVSQTASHDSDTPSNDTPSLSNPVEPPSQWNNWIGFREISSVEHIRAVAEGLGDVNAKAGDGKTLLHYAAILSSNVDVLKYLVENGADVNENNDDAAGTPLHCATMSNPNIDILKYLLESGADVRAKTSQGMMPLHCAAFNRNADVTKILVERGADVNAKMDEDKTPLYLAIAYSNADVVKVLIEQGADVNAKMEHGLTPLHYAVCTNTSIDILKILIEGGADLNAKANGDRTPLDMAITKGMKDILREAGGKSGKEL